MRARRKPVFTNWCNRFLFGGGDFPVLDFFWYQLCPYGIFLDTTFLIRGFCGYNYYGTFFLYVRNLSYLIINKCLSLLRDTAPNPLLTLSPIRIQSPLHDHHTHRPATSRQAHRHPSQVWTQPITVRPAYPWDALEDAAKVRAAGKRATVVGAVTAHWCT